MSVRILQIPDDVADWPDWLERELVGIHLYDLVEELEITSRKERKAKSLDETLGESRHEVLQRGLSALTPNQLHGLLRNPQHLLELQELMFVEGGGYWQQVPRSESQQKMAIDQWAPLAAKLSASRQSAAPTIEPPPIIRANERVEPLKRLPNQVDGLGRAETSPRSFGRRTLQFATLAVIAACVLFMVAPFFRTTKKESFFARASIQQSELVGQAYLEMLAETIRADWESRPKDSDEIFEQLIAFRDSCDVLLEDDLDQLRPEVAAELKTRCNKWRTKFDDALNQLATGADPEQVQADANQIVEQLLGVLSGLESAV